MMKRFVTFLTVTVTTPLICAIPTAAAASYESLREHSKPIGIAFLICFLLLVAMVLFLVYKTKKMDLHIHRTHNLDSETGIGNFGYFKQHFSSISDASRSLYYVSYFILDSINIRTNPSGLSYSDTVKYIASVLQDDSGEGEITARITENGFAYAFPCLNKTDACRVAEKVVGKVNRYLEIERGRSVIYAGVYHLHCCENDLEYVLFNLRRNIMQRIGQEEKVIFCDREMMNRAAEEQKMFKDLEQGIKNDEFHLYLQFAVNTQTGENAYAEVLSRWQHPEKGQLPPDGYIPYLESSGKIVEFDFYIFDKVCALLKKWSSGPYSSLLLSCNFTRITISQDDFLKRIKAISERHKIDRGKLMIEITEDALEHDRERAFNNICECKKMGFTIALDDLGCGYTSLINLCDYPIDFVKIDRDILLNCNNDNGKMLLRGLISMMHNMQLKTVCEGVETAEQNAFVTDADCDFIQGFFYHRPVAETEL